MFTRIIVTVAMLYATGVLAAEKSELKALTPYSLPAAAKQPIKELADRSDVLILGETHGTQEVPEVVASLLPTLSKMGYHVLALEVPSDQQAALTDWATGKTPNSSQLLCQADARRRTRQPADAVVDSYGPLATLSLETDLL